MGDVERVPTRRETPQALVDQLGQLHVEAAAGGALPWAVCIAGVGSRQAAPCARATWASTTSRSSTVWPRRRNVRGSSSTTRPQQPLGRRREERSRSSRSAPASPGIVEVVSGVSGLAGEVGHVVFVPGGAAAAAGAPDRRRPTPGSPRCGKQYAELGRPAPSARQLLLDAAADADAAAALDDAVAAVAFAAAVLVPAPPTRDAAARRRSRGPVGARHCAARCRRVSRGCCSRSWRHARASSCQSCGSDAAPRPAAVRRRDLTERRLTAAPRPCRVASHRLWARGGALVGEVENHEDIFRLCYVRGPRMHHRRAGGANRLRGSRRVDSLISSTSGDGLGDLALEVSHVHSPELNRSCHSSS